MASTREIHISAEDLDVIIDALYSHDDPDECMLEAFRLLRRSIKDNPAGDNAVVGFSLIRSDTYSVKADH
jgi:hypothetical protein